MFIDIPDVDITMSENKQSRYNNYVDISLAWPAEPVFIIKNKLVFLRESNPVKNNSLQVNILLEGKTIRFQCNITRLLSLAMKNPKRLNKAV